MICEKTSGKFCCEDISKIENYEQAMKDETQVWECHHRNEIQPDGARVSRDELKRIGLYYHRPASELVFLTKFEHLRLHHEGKTLSEETKRKLSESHKGIPSPNKGKHISEEQKRKISDANKGNTYWIGKHHSEESKRKISEAKKGKTLSEETRRKLSESLGGSNHPFFGKTHSEESKRKMSEAHKNISADTRRKMSEAKKGKIMSEESKRKISEAIREYWAKRKLQNECED